MSRSSISVDTTAKTQVLAAMVMAMLAVLGGLGVAIYVFDLTEYEDRFLGENPPETSFEFDYDNESRTLRVSHVSGDPVPGEELAFEYNGRVIRDWSAEEQVEAGDSILLYGIAPKGRVNVTWTGHDRKDDIRLTTWDGEEDL